MSRRYFSKEKSLDRGVHLMATVVREVAELGPEEWARWARESEEDWVQSPREPQHLGFADLRSTQGDQEEMVRKARGKAKESGVSAPKAFSEAGQVAP